MPYASIHAGSDYVVTWSYLVPGGGDQEVARAAVAGTRALGLEPAAVYVERDGVRVRAHAARDGAPWLPMQSGHVQVDRLEELGEGRSSSSSRSRTGGTAANVQRGAVYGFTFEAAHRDGWHGRGGSPADVAIAGLEELGFEVVPGGVWPSFSAVATERAGGLELPIEIAEVPGWGWTGGSQGTDGWKAAQQYPRRVRLVRVVQTSSDVGEPHGAARVGQAAPATSCRKLEPRGNAYPIMQGQRYRALVSASRHFSKDAIAKYLTDHGWSGVRLYEDSDVLPADWPRAGEDLDGLEDNHRWLRGDAVRSGPSDTIDVVSTLHKIISMRLSIYRIADLWACSAAASPSAPTASPAPSSSAKAPPTSAPASRSSPMVTLYAASWCKACHEASEWLTAQGIPFVEYDIEKEPTARAELARKLAAAGRPDTGVLPVLDVVGRLLVGFSPDAVQAALAAGGAPVALLRMGPSSGPGGLDPAIPVDLARSVETSWAFETDPNRLRGFAATLRQGGYPIAGSVLDQRALTVQSESHDANAAATAEAADKRRDRNLKVAGVVVGVVGIGVALVGLARK